MNYDKLQIISIRLGETIYNYFMGCSPVSTIDNARAVSEMIKGLRNHFSKKGLIDEIELEYNAKNTSYLTAKISNFSKHADRPHEAEQRIEINNYNAFQALSEATEDYLRLMEELLDKDLIDLDLLLKYWTKKNNPVEGNRVIRLTRLFQFWSINFIESNHIQNMVHNWGKIANELSPLFKDVVKKLDNDETLDRSTPEWERFMYLSASLPACVNEAFSEQYLRQSQRIHVKLIKRYKLWPIEVNGGVALKNSYEEELYIIPFLNSDLD